ncbi:POLR protein, partial [Nothocercus nigrocapillus]|nr:POLR protein [Nothocercus nigrocapillus]
HHTHTVNHQHIFQVLGQKGVDKHVIDLIHDLYPNCGTTVEVGGQRSDRIKILGGVKQGDPLSPILFSLALDPLLCGLESKGAGYKYGEQLVTSLAFADDLALLSDSWEVVNRNIKVVEDFCHQTRLRVQASK